MSDTMSILAPLPTQTQYDVIKKIKKIGLKKPTILVFREDWRFRFKIIVVSQDNVETIYVDYKKILRDRRIK